MKRQLAAMALAIGVITVFAGSALAGHLTTGVTSYTGCLVSKDGMIIKIKAGESPSSPCSGGMVQVHFSGGDITKISVTGALTGGGDNGEVTIGLKPEFTLPTGCVAGRVAEWNGTAWVCGVDNDTTYSPGTGLDLTGTTFSIDEAYRVKNTPDCPSGQFATGFDNAGAVTCAAPPAAASNTYVESSRPAVGIPDDGANHEILSIGPSEGTYLVIAKGTLTSALNVDDFSAVGCELQIDGTIVDEFRFGSNVTQTVTEIPFALIGAASLTSNAKLLCYADDGADGIGIEHVKLIGVKL
jgi:hypothetical protein